MVSYSACFEEGEIYMVNTEKVNIEKEIINILSILSKNNPTIPFKYEPNSRSIVADTTNIRKTMNCTDIDMSGLGYDTNTTSHGKVKISKETSKGDVEIAELSVDKCNLTDEKRNKYRGYINYHTGDKYVESISDRLFNANMISNRSKGINYSLAPDTLKNIQDNELEETADQIRAMEEFKKQLPPVPNKNNNKRKIEFNIVDGSKYNPHTITIPVEFDDEPEQKEVEPEQKAVEPEKDSITVVDTPTYSNKEYAKLLNMILYAVTPSKRYVPVGADSKPKENKINNGRKQAVKLWDTNNSQNDSGFGTSTSASAFGDFHLDEDELRKEMAGETGAYYGVRYEGPFNFQPLPSDYGFINNMYRSENDPLFGLKKSAEAKEAKKETTKETTKDANAVAKDTADSSITTTNTVLKDKFVTFKKDLKYFFTKSSKVEGAETLGSKINNLFETTKKNIKYTFTKSEKTNTLGNKVSNLLATTKKNVKYAFTKSEKVEKTNTLGSKINNLFETTKKNIKYTFTKSAKVESGYTIIGPGPKKIVKRPLSVKLKDSLTSIKNKATGDILAVCVTATIANNVRKMNNKPLSARVKGAFDGARKALKYTFTKSEKVKHVAPQVKPPIQPKPPVKPPVEPPVKPPVAPEPTEDEKQRDFLAKQHKLNCLTEYKKLGDLEKMFVDDATAECLYPEDSEFIQMLNERCVNKVQVLNYYRTITMSECKLNQDNILFLYASLDEYERMFIEDAIAEGITTIDDNEYRQMLSERCVNKNGINKFMNAYKDYIVKQKALLKRYNGIVNEDMLIDRTTDISKETRYNILTINQLRKLSKSHKDIMTDDERAMYNESKLKKVELVDILERQDEINIKRLKNGVCK